MLVTAITAIAVTQTGAAHADEVTPLARDVEASVLVEVGGRLFFSGYDGVHGDELWASDGSTAGTAMVKDVHPSSSGFSGPEATDVDGTAYFVGDDGVHGHELWKSDGTSAGTVMVKDIGPGADSAVTSNWNTDLELTDVDGTLFFRAENGPVGPAVWKSDGTAEGTVIVKDLGPGSSGWIAGLTNVGDSLYYIAHDGVDGVGVIGLWKTDGTTSGTELIAKFDSGTSGIRPSNLTDVDGTLYFTAYDRVRGAALWTSDGTAAGTVALKATGARSLTNVDGTLYFVGTGAEGSELWTSDGTTAGTFIVKDINPGPSDSSPYHLTAVNDTLFFVADNGVNGRELWKSDGTSAGTVMVKDIGPGRESATSANYSPDSLDFVGVGDVLYFSRYVNPDDHSWQWQLWTSDGTARGTTMVTSTTPSGASVPLGGGKLVDVGGTLYFTTPNRLLWRAIPPNPGISIAPDRPQGATGITVDPAGAEGGSAGPDRGESCPALKFVGVRGSGERYGEKHYGVTGFGKPVAALYSELLSRGLRGLAAIPIAYEAVPADVYRLAIAHIDDPVNALLQRPEVTSYKQSVAAGVSNLISTITNDPCRNQSRYILTGYSQGAHVVGDAIQSGKLASVRSRIVATVLLGDPTWNSALRGTAFRSTFTNQPGQGALGRRSRQGAFVGYHVRSYCRYRDPICQRDVVRLARGSYGEHTLYNLAEMPWASILLANDIKGQPAKQARPNVSASLRGRKVHVACALQRGGACQIDVFPTVRFRSLAIVQVKPNTPSDRYRFIGARSSAGEIRRTFTLPFKPDAKAPPGSYKVTLKLRVRAIERDRREYYKTTSRTFTFR